MSQTQKGAVSNSSGGTGRLKTFFHDSLLEISFGNEASKNAVDHETANELNELLSSLHMSGGCFRTRTIGALLFTADSEEDGSTWTGGSGVFLSGGNLKEIVNTPVRARSTMLLMQESCTLLRKLPCLSICLLSGRAIGGGAEFALAADQRWLASSAATLELKQRDWGLSSGWLGLNRLAELRPRGGYRAAALDFATGRIWSADELIADQLCDCDLRNTAAPERIEKAILASQNLLACPETLRKELLMTDRSRAVQPEILELLRFERLWGSDAHRQALEKYKTSKAKVTSLS